MKWRGTEDFIMLTDRQREEDVRLTLWSGAAAERCINKRRGREV
jgi:hypothetical protein